MGDLWHGFEKIEFEFEDRRAILVCPDKPDENKNWTLKTEYWDAFPQVEVALLEKGFHAAWLENISRFATDEDCDAKARFAEYLSKEYSLAPVCVPVGMSCGGAHAVNFAGRHPEKVKCMFIDAPVLNFCDFPGRVDAYENVWEKEFIKAYPGITRAKLLNFPDHPMNRISVLKDNKIPVIMLYGTEDLTVEYSKNGRIMEIEYADSPELLTVIPRYAQGHHPHCGFEETQKQVVDFIIKHSK